MLRRLFRFASDATFWRGCRWAAKGFDASETALVLAGVATTFGSARGLKLRLLGNPGVSICFSTGVWCGPFKNIDGCKPRYYTRRFSILRGLRGASRIFVGYGKESSEKLPRKISTEGVGVEVVPGRGVEQHRVRVGLLSDDNAKIKICVGTSDIVVVRSYTLLCGGDRRSALFDEAPWPAGRT